VRSAQRRCILAGQLPSLPHSEAVALGITLDLTLIVPLAYYYLVIRPRGWPLVTIAPVLVLSLIVASAVLPADHHQSLHVMKTLAIPAELGLLGWIGWQASRALRKAHHTTAADPLEVLYTSARAFLRVKRAADVLASELAVLYFALGSWRSRTHRPDDAWAFSSRAKSGHGGLVFALLVLTAVEAVAIHILLGLWSPALAWIFSVLSLYGALWLLADYRASVLRPVLVTRDEIWLRAGLRWRARVPRHLLAEVARTAPGSQECARSLAFLTAPNVWLEFFEPVSLDGPYGVRREVRWVGLFLDDPAALQRVLNRGT
jgi:hypothetical protein